MDTIDAVVNQQSESSVVDLITKVQDERIRRNREYYQFDGMQAEFNSQAAPLIEKAQKILREQQEADAAVDAERESAQLRQYEWEANQCLGAGNRKAVGEWRSRTQALRDRQQERANDRIQRNKRLEAYRTEINSIAAGIFRERQEGWHPEVADIIAGALDEIEAIRESIRKFAEVHDLELTLSRLDRHTTISCISSEDVNLYRRMCRVLKVE
jgi:hypothetical protein